MLIGVNWIYRYDREWYDKVTPKAKLGKEKSGIIDWEKRDEECLWLAREAVENILRREGKPIRVTPSSIRKTLGFGSWFKNEKLVRTQDYLMEVKEGINDFWYVNTKLDKIYKGCSLNSTGVK